jgi:hypothetical protein
MTLSFSEIKDGDQFEELVASYLRKLKEDKKSDNDVIEVDVKPPSKGPDGGRDILVTFRLDDGLSKFERIWVIQCKFHNRAVSPAKISKINIPCLVHSYNANGYLLICKKGVTSGTTSLIEGLDKDCSFGYHYKIWTGEEFLERLWNIPSIHQQYFQKYWQHLQKLDKKNKQDTHIFIKK